MMAEEYDPLEERCSLNCERCQYEARNYPHDHHRPFDPKCEGWDELPEDERNRILAGEEPP